MQLHRFAVVYVEPAVDNLIVVMVVVDKQLLDHAALMEVAVVVAEHLGLHMDHYDKPYKHHNLYKRKVQEYFMKNIAIKLETVMLDFEQLKLDILNPEVD